MELFPKVPGGGLEARAEEREARRRGQTSSGLDEGGRGTRTRRGGGGKKTRSIIHIFNFYSYSTCMSHKSAACTCTYRPFYAAGPLATVLYTVSVRETVNLSIITRVRHLHVIHISTQSV